MGCDIHIWAERKTTAGYEAIDGVKFAEGLQPFDWRSYAMYGFLAGVRNYSAVPPIAEPRGVPADASDEVLDDFEGWDVDAHSSSWLSVEELAAFDYGAMMEDRRVMINGNGGCTAEPGSGEMMTYREFLGDKFMADIERLRECGADRIVFWFDI